MKFDSVETLSGQLARDVKRAAAMVEPLLNPSHAVGSA